MTYYNFFNSLPDNARIQLSAPHETLLTSDEYLKRFKAYTNLDPATTELHDCQFTIIFI